MIKNENLKNWQSEVSSDKKNEEKGETRFWQLVDRKPNQVGTYV